MEDGAFYVVRAGEFRSEHDTELTRCKPLNEGPPQRCPDCGAARGLPRWLAPRYAQLTLRGSAWGDFAFTAGGGLEFLVSERVARLCQAERLVGLGGFEPVQVTRAAGGGRPPAYFHVHVAPGSAAVDRIGSAVVWNGPVTCGRCRAGEVESVHGFRLEQGSWGGQDVSGVRGLPGTAIASERFARLVRDNGLTNVRLIPTGDYKWGSPKAASR